MRIGICDDDAIARGVKTVIVFVTEHEERIWGAHDLNVAGFVCKHYWEE